MDKKSQVSLFIIFGGIILIAVIFLSYISSDIIKADVKSEVDYITTITPSSLQPIVLSIYSCTEQIAKDAVVYVGLHGGYYNVPEPKVTYFWDDYAYYLYEGKNTMPSKKIIEEQISNYIIEQLPECIDGLSGFQGVTIEGKIESVYSSIGKDKVLVNVNYPINIYKSDSRTQIPELRAEVPVRLDTIYEIASNITKEKIANNAVCVDCLIDLASMNNVFIDILAYKNDTLIFTIFDNTSKIDEVDYIFSFSTK